MANCKLCMSQSKQSTHTASVEYPMSFRITPERLAALKTNALACIAARAVPVEATIVEFSPEMRNLERALTTAKAHFAEGHLKGIAAILGEFSGLGATAQNAVLEKVGIRRAGAPGFVHKAGEFVVMTRDVSSHNYPIGECVIALAEQDVCLKFNRGTGELENGNYAPFTYRDSWHFATTEEVEAWFAMVEAALAERAAKPDALLAKLGLAV